MSFPPEPAKRLLHVAMFDSVDIEQIPANAQAVAGYVDGKWKTANKLRVKFPNARLVTIATSVKSDADCLDVERLDATNAEAAAWVKRQWARGVRKPILYTSVSNWKSLADELARNGVRHRSYGKSYKRWSAHYTYKPHRCGKSCGMPGLWRAGATQWTDKALGRNLDESLVARFWFPKT